METKLHFQYYKFLSYKFESQKSKYNLKERKMEIHIKNK